MGWQTLEKLEFVTEDVKVYGYKKPQKWILSTIENWERLEKYVEERFLASGVIPEWHCNPKDPSSVAYRTVYLVWRNMPRLVTLRDPQEIADFYIDLEIKYPPPLTDRKHFSLKEFVRERGF